MAPTYSEGNKSHRPSLRPAGADRQGLPMPAGSNLLPVGQPDGTRQRQAKKLLMDREQLSILRNDLRVIGLYVNSRHLEMLAPDAGDSLYTSQACMPVPAQCERNGIAVYQITKLVYNDKENSFEKLVSVYSALNSFGGVAALILRSDGKYTKLYLCTNTSGEGKIAGKLLANNLRGQFPGCEISELEEGDRDSLLDSFGEKGISPGKTVRSLSMIPSRRDDERQHDKEFSAQGYEKFIDAMKGHRYTLVVLSQRVSPDAAEEYLEGLEDLYTNLSPYAKETVSFGENDSDTVNYSISNNINSSVSRSISRSFGTSHTDSVSQGRSSNRGSGYEIFDVHFNSGQGTSYGTSSTSGSSTGVTGGETAGESYGSGDSESSGSTVGTNRSLTLERANKAVQDLLVKIEEHIKRIQASQTFGMWNSACYVIADSAATAAMGTSTLAALYAGDSQAAPRACYNQWDATNPEERSKVLTYIQNLRHPQIDLTMRGETIDGSGSKTRFAYQTERVTPAMMISGKEIATLMGLPRKSVPGVVVDHIAEFGRNISELWKGKVKRPLPFGKIYHMGQEESTETLLDLDAFASHLFICGASGSGKSNTTYHLLQELIERKIPFLVIEPAKGEYKIEFANVKKINIFTADESPYRRLQINPFEFSAGIHVREHLDQVLQVVSACWPLYGAMPGLLKKAFEQVYLDYGWDLEHSERIAARGSKFPVFKDLAPVLERIIDESPYSAQTKGDYKGALLNRVSSLCNGYEGQIFGRTVGIPERTLFNENTIVDLSHIGSDETRSLVMGILIVKLRNYRNMTKAGPNSELKHVTVLEEAHNILKRCSQETDAESGNVQGAAVASLCRCIAEMRSAGEGFMIIDQSPGAVDEAAIKNTAIKIVMRLPSKTDCEEIGAALSLEEEQIRELSRLDIGVAAIYHAGWTDTVLARMGSVWDGRYRGELPRLDLRAYTCVQGAVVQRMYDNLRKGIFDNTYDDVKELLEILCREPNEIKPPLRLPEAKQQELLDEVQIFSETNEEYIKRNQVKKLEGKFFEFVFEFLRLDSVMKIFGLSGVNTKSGDPQLSEGEKQAVTKWEREVRSGIIRYLNMPAECDPEGCYSWPGTPKDAEHFWPIYEGVLSGYCNRCRDVRYKKAIDYLNKQKYFAPGGAARRK